MQRPKLIFVLEEAHFYHYLLLSFIADSDSTFDSGIDIRSDVYYQ